MRLIDGRRHGNNHEISLFQGGRISTDFQMNRRLEIGAAHLAGRIDMLPIVRHLACRQIVTDGSLFLAEFDGQRQTDVTQTHHCNNSHQFSIL
jgi:hypothetical protein